MWLINRLSSFLGYLAIKINTMSPALINVYPNYLFVYGLHFGCTFVATTVPKKLNLLQKNNKKNGLAFQNSRHDVDELDLRSPFVGCLTFTALFYARNKDLRSTLLKEMNEFLGKFR